MKGPEIFYNEYILGHKPEISKSRQANFDEGSYAHTLILEPEMKDIEYAFFPDWKKAGKDWNEFKEKHGDKTILSKPQVIRVNELIEMYRNRPEAVELISGGFPEHTLAGELMGVNCKVRADYINVDRGYIVDIKTTARAADIDTFKFTCQDYGYYISAAMYTMMFSDFYEKEFDFYFLALSKDKTYNTCELYKISKDTMQYGRNMIIKAINLYKKCKETNDWTKHAKPKIETSGTYEILEI